MRFIVDENIPFIKGRLEPHGEVVYVDQHGFTPALVKDADAVVIRTRTLCNEALLADSKVKLVATATIGMDQIDIPWCEARGITVRNAPGCNAPGVAQWVWSVLLRMGFDCKRDTLGIVGCGNVGGIVKEWGESLGVKMLICDPPRAEREGNESFVSLETLLKESNAVTLHTPLTRTGEYATHHLISLHELELLMGGKIDKPILLNAARGPVVDNNALLAAMNSGGLRTAIDTWEYEPEVNETLLWGSDFATYHIAGYSRQGKERATRMALEAIEDTFGIEIDKTGLSGAYTGAEGLTQKSIIESYDPGIDTSQLRMAPEMFDQLRGAYNYREEWQSKNIM